MSEFRYAALEVVPPDWTSDKPICLSRVAYKRYFETFVGGEPVLIYKASPVDAIVAEGEMIAPLMPRVGDWPAPNVPEPLLTGLGTLADYVLPLRILYAQPSFNYVGLADVENWVDDPAFPYVEWTPISREAYAEFTNWP
jgi:hypothetical protein